MFALSGVALIWFLQQFGIRAWGYALDAAAYIYVAAVLAQVLR